MGSSIAPRWRLLSGEKEWKGLLDPLDLDLRHYIIHYGERAAAISDAYISEEKSKNCGLSRYARRHLFSEVGLETSNPYKYMVKKYVYAATELAPGKSHWLAYVAVATDEGKQMLGRRDILISWRGTVTNEEAGIDMLFDFVSASDILGEENEQALVHHGWLAYYTNVDPESPYNKTSCRAQVLAAVRDLVDQYKDEEISITVTGHSMGAAFAILNATDIAYNGYNKPTFHPDKACLVTAIVFASPRLGDQGFRNVFYSLKNLHVLRITNDYDIVPSLPPSEFYVHVGKELRIDTAKSPFLKDATSSLHELEVYLHGVAGTQGQNGDFRLVVIRDLALINKKVDGLKDEYNVVAEWWIEKNKSMVQIDDGTWVLMDDHEDEDSSEFRLPPSDRRPLSQRPLSQLTTLPVATLPRIPTLSQRPVVAVSRRLSSSPSQTPEVVAVSRRRRLSSSPSLAVAVAPTSLAIAPASVAVAPASLPLASHHCASTFAPAWQPFSPSHRTTARRRRTSFSGHRTRHQLLSPSHQLFSPSHRTTAQSARLHQPLSTGYETSDFLIDNLTHQANFTY